MKYCVWVVVVMILIGMMVVGCGENKTENSRHGELWDVELAVAAFMAAPDSLVTNLITDPRIASITRCGTVASYNDCTHDVNTLIEVEPDSELAPLRQFTITDTFHSCYCVYPDGSVVGFSDNEKQL